MNPSKAVMDSWQVANSQASKFMETWLSMCGGMSWSQDQMEKTFEQYVKRGMIAQQDALKMVKDTTERAIKNQQEFYRIVKEATVEALDNVHIPALTYIDNLSKKIDELEKKVENI